MRILAAFLAAHAAYPIAAHSSNDPSLPSSDNSFAYSQSYSLDLSENDWDELDDSTSASSDAAASTDNMSISSSLLYDEGFLLSSLAIIGGDIPEPTVEPRIDEDESDNDDDNDGSSSMLSNSSLKKHPCTAVGPSSKEHVREDTSENNVDSEHNLRSGAQAMSLLLKIRGGAVTSRRASAAPTTAASKSSAPTRVRSRQAGTQILKGLFTTALVTLVFEAMIGHILEFLKIRMQTASDTASYATVLADITSSKGIIGLWDGFCPWGVIQAVFKGAIFGLAYAVSLSLFAPLTDQGILSKQAAYTFAGGFAGGMQGYVLSPTLLLKTRVMTNPIFRESMSLLETTSQSFRVGFDVVAQEGVAALMKGSNVFALKRVLDWSSRYYFADMFERLLTKLKKGKKLTVGEKSVASLLGGVASTCFTLPLDVLVAKTQDAKKAGVRVNALVLFQDELREVGWSGLQRNYMRGFEARLVHVSLTTLVIKTWTPLVYSLLFPVK